MDPAQLFRIITNSTLLATRFLSLGGPLQFVEPEYCALLPEDSVPATAVATVTARHNKGWRVTYKITDGNDEGLFRIDSATGTISLSAALDHEARTQHELSVTASGGGSSASCQVMVMVGDVNDNAPHFPNPKPVLTVIEEDDRDLPLVIATVSAMDVDWVDREGLLYTLTGDGVDGLPPEDAYFTVDSQTGELTQLRPLDRDPPHGKPKWHLRVGVSDGQKRWRPVHAASPLVQAAKGRQKNKREQQSAAAQIQAAKSRHKDKRDQLRADTRFLNRTHPGPDGTDHLSSDKLTSTASHQTQYSRVFDNDVLIDTNANARELNDKLLERSNLRKEDQFLAVGTQSDREMSTTSEQAMEIGYTKLPKCHHCRTIRRNRKHSAKYTSENARHMHDSSTLKLLTPGYSKLINEANKEYKKPISSTRLDNSFASSRAKHSETSFYSKLNGRRKIGHYRMRRVVLPSFHRRYVDLKKNSPYLLKKRRKRFIPSTTSRKPEVVVSKVQSHAKLSLGNEPDVSRRSNLGSYFIFRKSKFLTHIQAGQLEKKNSVKFSQLLTTKQCFGTENYRKCSEPIDRENVANRETLFQNRLNDRLPFSNNVITDHIFTSNITDPYSFERSHKLRGESPTPVMRAITDKVPSTIPNRSGSNLMNRSYNAFNQSEIMLGSVYNYKTSIRDEAYREPSKQLYGMLYNSENSSFSHRYEHRTEIRNPINPISSYLSESSHSNLDKLQNTLRHQTQSVGVADITKDNLSINKKKNSTNQSIAAPLVDPYQEIVRRIVDSDRAHVRATRSWSRITRSALHPSKAILLTRGGCLKPSDTTTVNSSFAGSLMEELHQDRERQIADDEDLMEQYQRLLWTSEVERGVWRRIHVVEAEVTVVVKDINDNSPIFRQSVIHGEVQENGPIDLSVAVVSAHDADDSTEGSNARLTYAIEKNVLDERTGAPMFQVNAHSGLLSSALCCLDRETTPEYQLQVVATDGGGLKGTGTVLVRLNDVNDNSPKLSRSEYKLEIPETWGRGPPDDTPLLDLAVTDADTSNYFFYRIVEDSGWGWDHFTVRTDTSASPIPNVSNDTNPPVGGDLTKGFSVYTGDFNVHHFSEQYGVEDAEVGEDKQREGRTPQPSAGGKLFAAKTLDYENETHRRGFRFLVQVTDKGPGGWSDPRHMDEAWVSVRLKDVNDNAPQFQRNDAHVTVREDVRPGTTLVAMPAHDSDEGGAQEVDYHLEEKWLDQLRVDSSGAVRVVTSLDREGEHVTEKGVGVVRVIAVDRGRPPLSSTASVTLTLTDVNDCPPDIVVTPAWLHIVEEGEAARVGTLTATDRDVSSLGHGPPFNFSLAKINKPHVLQLVILKPFPMLDGGRGGAELWTTGPIDRESHRTLAVQVTVADAGRVAATHKLVLHIDDINDNPMLPATKTVYLWIPRGGNGDASLGRVYVDDPDDRDIADKSFGWRGAPHPLFSLDPKTGVLYSTSHVREGRYELTLSVSDSMWQQNNIPANVSVLVKELDPMALSHAIPLTLFPASAQQLTQHWTPSLGGGMLGTLLEAVTSSLKGMVTSVEVVSLTDLGEEEDDKSSKDAEADSGEEPSESSFHKSFSQRLPRPSACVWLTAKTDRDSYMDSVKLQGLIGLNVDKLEDATNYNIIIQDETDILPNPFSYSSSSTVPSSNRDHLTWHPSSATSLASTTVPLQVVDGNSSSLVTPRLSRPQRCTPRSPVPSPLSPSACSLHSCLNGGHCASFTRGSRCVCPGHTTGSFCKIPSRSFSGKGWAWLPPLPPCSPTHISFKFLTTQDTGLLLYSGSLSLKQRRNAFYTDKSSRLSIQGHQNDTGYLRAIAQPPLQAMLAVQLTAGKLQVIVENPNGDELPLSVNSSYILSDGVWHDVHIKLRNQGISVMVDRCSDGWDITQDPQKNPRVASDHCLAFARWQPKSLHYWRHSGVLQLGGAAQTASRSGQQSQRKNNQGTKSAITERGFKGCISHLRINEALVDLGKVSYSRESTVGCQMQEDACRLKGFRCGARGRCVGGVGGAATCSCVSGFAGVECKQMTEQATLMKGSYAKLAVSFTPHPVTTSLQVRIRTRRRTGLLLQLSAHHKTAAFSLRFRAGELCAIIEGIASYSPQGRQRAPEGSVLPSLEACLVASVVADGVWHTITAQRFGHQMVLEVDDGDQLHERNETLVMLSEEAASFGPPHRLLVDKQDGICMGGKPYFSGINVLSVEDDFYDSCISDIRVDGHQLPLPPGINGTQWGQVTTWQELSPICEAQASCSPAACAAPLRCVDTWRSYTCGCPAGYRLGAVGCQPVDECLSAPCLHGSSCQPVLTATSPKSDNHQTSFRSERTARSTVSKTSIAQRRVENSNQPGISLYWDNSSRPHERTSINFPRSDVNSSDQMNLTYGSEHPQLSWSELSDGEVGYRCECGPWHSGRYCEWRLPRAQPESFFGPVLGLTLLLTVAFCVSVIAVWLSLALFKRWRRKNKQRIENIQLSKHGCSKDEDITGSPSILTAHSLDTDDTAAIHCLQHLEMHSSEHELIELPDDRIHQRECVTPPYSKPRKSCLKQGTKHGDGPSISPQGIHSISKGVTDGAAAAHSSTARLPPSRLRCPSACPGSQPGGGAVRDAAPDDLRAYAYEGEGSSGSSWTSTVSGLPSDGSSDGGGSFKCRLLPEFGQVIDLLQNLPDAVVGRSPSLLQLNRPSSQHPFGKTNVILRDKPGSLSRSGSATERSNNTLPYDGLGRNKQAHNRYGSLAERLDKTDYQLATQSTMINVITKKTEL